MKKIYLTFLAALIAFSCDEFLDVNTNPNQATESNPELVLAAALNATASQNFYNQMGAMFAGQWSPSGDVSGFVQEKTYDFNNTYGTAIWLNFYDILTDFKYVQEADAAAEQHASAAIAKIMSTWIYHKLVDTYNNVPYTDALQGTTVIRPTYDNGQAVYEAIIDDLDEAVAEINAISSVLDDPGAADIVFGGDMEKWVQFANSLKLRLLIRQSEMPGRESYITTEIGQISGGFLTEDAGANPGYLQTAGKQNPFWDAYYRSENNQLRNTYNFIRSTEFIQSLTAGDPRAYRIIGPDAARPHNDVTGAPIPAPFALDGVQYGDDTPNAYSNATSGIGIGILRAFNQDVILFTAAESFFLQAEAVMRGWMSGDAIALYEQGVTASFVTLQVPDAINAASTFIDDAATWDGTDLEQLITQKYIASIGFAGFEAWSDYRRTGFPDVPLSIKAIKDAIPVRLYYPVQELQTNADNVAAQGTIDAITSRVFWDVN